MNPVTGEFTLKINILLQQNVWLINQFADLFLFVNQQVGFHFKKQAALFSTEYTICLSPCPIQQFIWTTS